MRMADPCQNKLFGLFVLFAAKLPLSDRIHVYLVLFLLRHNLAIVPHTTAVAATTAFLLLMLRIDCHFLVL